MGCPDKYSSRLQHGKGNRLCGKAIKEAGFCLRKGLELSHENHLSPLGTVSLGGRS